MSISRQQAEVQFPKTGSSQVRGNEDGDESSSPSSPIKKSVQEVNKKVKAKYRECRRNHAASMGGNARDGCGEFMPRGEEGTLEALKCSACGCHRNFHRKETEGEFSFVCCHSQPCNNKVIKSIEYPSTGALVVSSRTTEPQRMRMGAVLPSESEEQEEIGGDGAKVDDKQQVKKRFRTKFTQEQKEKMLSFAERAGWRIQKQEESVVQHFCQEIGIKPRVLKVWMHNNKHNFATNKPAPH